eukprot:1144337-Pelagomonas_calceolata.AAC.4
MMLALQAPRYSPGRGSGEQGNSGHKSPSHPEVANDSVIVIMSMPTCRLAWAAYGCYLCLCCSSGGEAVQALFSLLHLFRHLHTLACTLTGMRKYSGAYAGNC